MGKGDGKGRVSGMALVGGFCGCCTFCAGLGLVIAGGILSALAANAPQVEKQVPRRCSLVDVCVCWSTLHAVSVSLQVIQMAVDATIEDTFYKESVSEIQGKVGHHH